MYELNKIAFGSFLAQLRREKGMTQKELAACLYVSDKAVSKWERGLSVPDISLLVPLAEQLNVTVAELLHGCRVEEEQRFTREETEELIRKALTFSAEPPERRQARTQKFLPLYGVSVVLGLVETVAVWAVVLAGASYIRGYIFDCLFAGVQFSFSGYFCAYGKSGLSFLHNTLSILLVRVPGAYLASKFFPQTLLPMGLASACGSLFSILVCVIAYHWLKRQQKAVLHG